MCSCAVNDSYLALMCDVNDGWYVLLLCSEGSQLMVSWRCHSTAMAVKVHRTHALVTSSTSRQLSLWQRRVVVKLKCFWRRHGEQGRRCWHGVYVMRQRKASMHGRSWQPTAGGNLLSELGGWKCAMEQVLVSCQLFSHQLMFDCKLTWPLDLSRSWRFCSNLCSCLERRDIHVCLI